MGCWRKGEENSGATAKNGQRHLYGIGGQGGLSHASADFLEWGKRLVWVFLILNDIDKG